MSSDNLTGTTSSAPSLRVKWFEDLADIEPLEGAWRALEGRVNDRTVFVSWDHLLPWYRHYRGIYGEPLVGAAYRGDALVAVAPLVISRTTLGHIPVRQVDFAGYDGQSGEFLVPDEHPEMAGALIASLVESVSFDVIRLGNMATDSAVYAAVARAAQAHGLRLHLEDHAYAIVDLRDGYEAYCRRMSRNFRRNLKKMTERVARLGPARIEGARIGSEPAAIDRALQRLIAIEAESWKAIQRGYPLEECHRSFMQENCRRFGARGMLDIAILTIGGRDAAYIMALVERGVYYDFTISFNEKFAEVSPGTYLMLLLLAELPQRGIHTVVSHGPHSYKKRWATAFVPMSKVYIIGRSPRARLARFNHFVLAPRLGRAPVREWE